ncbi:hypothetical protein [Ligilactobacillus aviarius]|uniref:hypothetical protein n=1 Tax=Ligilactobacillus aviarius TaxID=1606 RepID=UPI00255BB988|nr:hypothetical protein [Ligilactobacillus aviarius]
MFEKEKQAIIDCPDDMIKVSDFYHLLDTAFNEDLITKEQFDKWNEVLDYVIPVLVKGVNIDPSIAQSAFVLTHDMFRNNKFIKYVVKRMAGKYGINLEG